MQYCLWVHIHMYGYTGRLNSSTFYLYFVCLLPGLRFVALDILILHFAFQTTCLEGEFIFRFLWWCQSNYYHHLPCKWFHGAQLFPVCGLTIVLALQWTHPPTQSFVGKSWGGKKYDSVKSTAWVDKWLYWLSFPPHKWKVKYQNTLVDYSMIRRLSNFENIKRRPVSLPQ